MSNVLQTPNGDAVAEAAPATEAGPVSVLQPVAIPMDKLTDKVTLYSGVMPMTFTIEAMVEKMEAEGMPVEWFVTLHLTGFGSTQRVFASDTVSVALDTVTPISFPAVAHPSIGGSQYGLNTVSGAGGSLLTANVKLSSPVIPGGIPRFQILNTQINAQWIIGAIDILITDPPIMFQKS